MTTAWNGAVHPSRHDYVEWQKNAYIDLEADDLPNKYGGTAARRSSIRDQFVRFNNEGTTDALARITPNQHVLWNGRNNQNLVTITTCYDDNSKTLRFDNPMANQPVKLHPIEVTITPFAVEQMRRVAIEVCKDDTGKRHENKTETGGFLGGQPKQDEHGRWYTAIQFSYADPKQRGTESDFVFSKELQRSMDNTLALNGFHKVGFWHSHPTYGPFQSDERLQPYGADVQTTHRFCAAFWSVALVIDPMAGPERDTVQLGAYKINGNHESLSNEDSTLVGWRSVGIGVQGLRSFVDLREALTNENPTSLEREELQFEYDMYVDAAKHALSTTTQETATSWRNVQQFLLTDAYPLITHLSESEAKALFDLAVEAPKYHPNANRSPTIASPSLQKPTKSSTSGKRTNTTRRRRDSLGDHVLWSENDADHGAQQKTPLLPGDEEIELAQEQIGSEEE